MSRVKVRVTKKQRQATRSGKKNYRKTLPSLDSGRSQKARKPQCAQRAWLWQLRVKREFLTVGELPQVTEEPALRLLDTRQVACHYAKQFLDGVA
ncbi:hypothetical protein C5612_03255 [Pseudomonas frederiksbergensis]|uniref:Uncharacterized protein n=1 Tax=Pseudomonas frederiksbergensis TaxID=104087 RepID=A0A2S8HSY6_9PSED|nr:hypothetical protein C5612_03255 [Pseudomonas frederiksbergensis]